MQRKLLPCGASCLVWEESSFRATAQVYQEAEGLSTCMLCYILYRKLHKSVSPNIFDEFFWNETWLHSCPICLAPSRCTVGTNSQICSRVFVTAGSVFWLLYRARL